MNAFFQHHQGAKRKLTGIADQFQNWLQNRSAKWMCQSPRRRKSGDETTS